MAVRGLVKPAQVLVGGTQAALVIGVARFGADCGVEALTGILMCGLSTALFFAVVSKRILQRMGGKEPGLTA